MSNFNKDNVKRSVTIDTDFYEIIKKEASDRKWSISFMYLEFAKAGYHSEKKHHFKDLIADIQHWQKKTFGDKMTSIGALNHLQQELIEVREELKKEEKTENLGEELADCFFMFLQICKVENIDLQKELRQKLQKNKARKWQKPDENGVINHKK